jgi:hypothetical protein
MKAFGLKSLVIIGVVLLPLSAHSAKWSKETNPKTGQDCVLPTNGPQDSTQGTKLYFVNSCGKGFRVEAEYTDGTGRSSWVGADGGKTFIWCIGAQCQGAKWGYR